MSNHHPTLNTQLFLPSFFTNRAYFSTITRECAWAKMVVKDQASVTTILKYLSSLIVLHGMKSRKSYI